MSLLDLQRAPRHPAKYSDCLLPLLGELVKHSRRVLDPFAGTGKLRRVIPGAYLVELEYPWARAAGAVQGDALALPFAAGTFDAVCTSPTYGNRMADHHEARDSSRRNTYRHVLGQPLHPHNAGALQWGDKYKEFHRAAWRECLRVLAPGGRFILNISDHIRSGERVRVAAWHIDELQAIGLALGDRWDIETPRNRGGSNGAARVSCEYVLLFEKPGTYQAGARWNSLL